MPIDERQFEVNAIMDTLTNEERYNPNAIIPSVSIREHKLWIAQHPRPEDNRSLIEDTDFKPPKWAGKFIKLIRPKRSIRRK